MNLPVPRYVRKYSARRLAVGAAFCPSCKRRLSDRDIAVCPSCGFEGNDTMSLFPMDAPPLELLSDHASLFTSGDRSKILRAIRRMRRAFPQLHWRILTADLDDNVDVGLFAFWLFNVSPPGGDEDVSLRPWTVLLVILPSGDLGVVPGYAAEVWLSGNDWSRLLQDLHEGLVRRHYGPAIRDFLAGGRSALENSWLRIAENRNRRKAFER